jgi:hypothetical protein
LVGKEGRKIYHFSFVICHFSSSISTCHAPSAVCQLLSAICHLPFSFPFSPHLGRSGILASIRSAADCGLMVDQMENEKWQMRNDKSLSRASAFCHLLPAYCLLPTVF